MTKTIELAEMATLVSAESSDAEGCAQTPWYLAFDLASRGKLSPNLLSWLLALIFPIAIQTVS